MKFGILHELQQKKPWTEDHDYRTYWDGVEQVKKAEEYGFEYSWAVEHHFLTEFSHSSSPEVWLATVAQHTSTIRIGHGVVQLPAGFNPTFHIAERVAALDVLSNGRVEFGTGRSITEAELGGFGIDPASSRPQWQEVVRAIPQMWTNERFPGFTGEHLDLPAREVWPKPIQKPHPPIWMAATSPSSFEVAGLNGLGLLTFVFGRPEALAGSIASYRDALTRAEPAGAFVNDRIGGWVIAHCAEDRKEAREIGGLAAKYYADETFKIFMSVSNLEGYETYAKMMGDMGQEIEDLMAKYNHPVDALADMGVVIIGTPDDCAEAVARYDDLDLDHLITMHQMADLPHEKVMKSIELFGEYVIPKFTEPGPVRTGTEITIPLRTV